jgi:Tol biopolymer transport system component
MSLSPDGRFAAYSARSEKTSSDRDIFLLATDGSGEVPLVVNSADDHVLGWAPDGKRLVFASDRTGSMGIWMIAVADGKPQGAAELLKPHMEGIYTMGFSRGGSFYYALVCRGQNVYTATLDLEKGELLTPPAEAMQRVEGHNWSPAWSPDGRYLACLLTRGPESRFYIRSMDTNEVRELAPNVREFGASKFNNRNSFFWNGDCLNWSPDGRALLCAGAGAEETGGTRVMSIDVQTGEVTRIGASQISYAPMSAPDGNALFYVRGGTFVRLNRGSDVEQELFRRAEQRGDVATRFTTLSPDGRLVAYAKGGALKVLPATGGATRELVTGEGYITAVAWMPDGQHLLFQRSGTAGLQLWRIPAIGGEPRKLDVDLPAMVHLRVHPDGRQIAFGAQVKEGRKNEIWALENFIPPLANPPAPAAEADSAAKSD